MATLPPGVEIRGERAPAAPNLLSSSFSSVPPRGRGLFATRSFQPGEQIAVFGEPLVLVSASRQALAVCNYCLDGRRQPVKACTGCRAAAYCGSACQRAHWRAVHKLECKVMRAALEGKDAHDKTGKSASGAPGPRSLPTPVRALVQILLRWQAVRAAVDGLEGNVAAFRQHPPGSASSALWDDMMVEAMAACSFAGWTGAAMPPTAEGGTATQAPTPEQLEAAVQILCKIQTNAFDRSDADVFPEVGGQTGIFLDPGLAMVNHACVPTAVVAFAGRQAFLRAEQPLQAGDEITISYIDYTKPRFARQRALALYHFTCACPRCADDLDVYQVCRASPLLPLNQTLASLLTDVDVLRNPPIAAGPTSAEIDAIYKECDPETPVSPADRLARMRRHWALCRPLVDARRWAVEPLASVFQQAIMYYSVQANFAHALAVECFVALHVDPYKYVAPFAQPRIKAILLIAKTITNLDFSGQSGAGEGAQQQGSSHVHPGITALLFHFGDGLVYDVLLLLFLHHSRAAHSDVWPLRETVVAMQRFVDTDSSYMATALKRWVDNPPDQSETSSFVREHVLAYVEKVARLGLEVLKADLKI